MLQALSAVGSAAAEAITARLDQLTASTCEQASNIAALRAELKAEVSRESGAQVGARPQFRSELLSELKACMRC